MAIRILAGSGLSLVDAARAALAQRGAPTRTETLIETAIDGFMRRALEMRLRGQTYDFYESKLRQFSERFAERTLDGVSRADIRGWLEGEMTVSPVTRRGTLRAVHALYSWARSKEPPLCAVHACEGLRIEEPRSDHGPSVLQRTLASSTRIVGESASGGLSESLERSRSTAART